MNRLTLVELIDIITGYLGEIETQFLKDVSEVGLTVKQMEYIEAVGRLGHPTLGELAGDLSLSRPSVTAIVEKLDQMGYIERVRSESDRRSAHVHLTEKGDKLISSHAEAHRKIAAVFEKNLNSEDLKKLTEILNRAVSNLMIGE